MECKVTEIIHLADRHGQKIDAWLTIGEVVGIHINDQYIKDGIFDTAAARPLGRCGYRGDYVEVNTIFEMVRPR
jgi:flavin reductase (DIM6/NTAB) family NADH-FMN oxidoreductase RutF